MFPFFETSAAWSDFGEVINPDDYMIKEENMELTSLQVNLPNRIIEVPVTRSIMFYLMVADCVICYTLYASLLVWNFQGHRGLLNILNKTDFICCWCIYTIVI